MNTIGIKLLHIRKINGLNQAEMGQRLGLTQQTVSNYENNKVEPKPPVLSHCILEFGLHKDYFKDGFDMGQVKEPSRGSNIVFAVFKGKEADHELLADLLEMRSLDDESLVEKIYIAGDSRWEALSNAERARYRRELVEDQILDREKRIAASGKNKGKHTRGKDATDTRKKHKRKPE